MKKFIGLFWVYFCFVSGIFAQDLRFVQVTDVNYSPNNEILPALVKDINEQQDVDFVVFTGNNIQNPDKKILEGFLKEAKKLKRPFYMAIGNKDVNKHKNLSKKQYASFLKRKLSTHKQGDLNYTFTRCGVVFIVADGSRDVIPTSVGYYKEDVVDWVDATLDLYPKKNVIILQHFPLVSEQEKNTPVTFKPEKYLGVLEKHSNVRAVIAGHSDVNSEKELNNVLHINTAPAPYYRIIDILDCNSHNPTVWAEVKIAE